MHEEIPKAYYAVIPANVRYDKSLKDKAKLLYGEITALCNDKGYCWASNTYFADLYDISRETVSRLIKNLVDSGYLINKIIYHDNSKEIKERRLYVVDTKKSIDEKDIFTPPIDQIVNTPIDENINTPIDQNIKTLLTKKSKRIIHINNTLNNNINQSSQSVLEEPKDRLTDLTDEHIEAVLNILKTNMAYEDYIYANPYHNKLADEIMLNIQDMYFSTEDRIKIGKEDKPATLVRNVLHKIRYIHLEHIVDNYLSLDVKIKNKKAYLRTMIYNSVFEVEAHYTNEARVNMNKAMEG
jgi:DNA-binding Lrp family transcriptional regulator